MKVRRKGKVNGRRKGKVGELELAAFLRERGITARRGVQFKGGADSPDIVTDGALSDIHFECKRVENGSLYEWLAQAIRDAGDAKTPVVAHRKNDREWVAILRLSDLLRILKDERFF